MENKTWKTMETFLKNMDNPWENGKKHWKTYRKMEVDPPGIRRLAIETGH